jgi:shikimate kinase
MSTNQSIILLGMKHCGKTRTALALSQRYGFHHIATDEVLIDLTQTMTGNQMTVREIHQSYGGDTFRCLEQGILTMIEPLHAEKSVIDLGGGTPLNPGNHSLIKQLGTVFWIKPDTEENYRRIIAHGIPSFFAYPEDPRRSYDELIAQRFPIYQGLADIIIEPADTDHSEDIAAQIMDHLPIHSYH